MGSDKFCGVVEMQQPILLIKDLEIVKKVLIKDFDHFVDRRSFVSSSKQEIVNKMVGNLTGEEWKGVRTSLSPTFTTGKIRRMMGFFNNVSIDWVEYLKENITKSGRDSVVIQVHKETTHYTTDVIAAAVFGMSAGTVRNPESRFSKMLHKLSDMTLLKMIKFGLSVNFPKIIKLLGISVLNDEAIDFFVSLFKQGMKARMDGTEKRNDFIQLLVEAKKGELKAAGLDELSAFEKDAELSSASSEKKNYLNEDLVAEAQALGFFFAGFSTISNFIGFVMYLLALNPDVQEKLRKEVNSKLFSKGDGKNVDYDELNKLVYLDMVVCEVLRKYAPLDRLERVCTKDYHDPSENLKVPKGAMVGIPVRSIHNGKKYYEYPEKFYPEHFTPEKKSNRNPYAFLVFGMRFALVESKAAVAHLVHNFIIEPTRKTPIPVKVKPVGLGVQIPEDLELNLKLAN